MGPINTDSNNLNFEKLNKQAKSEGKDVYRLAASIAYNYSYDKVPDDLREEVKLIIHFDGYLANKFKKDDW